MKKLILLWLAAAAVALAQQVTPNIGLLIQTPPQYANNWGAITNYNFQKIDTAFAGVGSQWRGAWSSVTAYTAGNFVSYLGNYYLAIQNSTNQNPVTQTAYWVEVNGSGGCTGVTPGSYTNTNLTVNSAGCVTAASNGSGGSGGIVPPNPSTTTYAILTDSRGLSSTTSGITIPAATAAVCGSGICIITAPNNFKAGDWVGFCCSGFSPSALVGNPYYAQILSAGLSSTQFEIASNVTATGTGGAIVDASYNWPLAMADPNILPNSYFYGHGTVLDYNPTSGETLANLISFYNANVHSISPVITSNPGYLFIHAGYDDYIINGECATGAALAMEPGFQQLWAIAHQDGWKVAQLTNPANSTASGSACNNSSFYLGWSITNEWMKAQGKGGYVAATLGTASASSTSLAITDGTTTALYQAIVATGVPDNTYITACSPACGTAGAMTLTLSQATTAPLSSTAVYLRNQWWDYLIDAASELNDITQNLTQPTNGPHYSDQGNQLIAQLANATFISGNLQLKNQAGNGDSAPNITKTNWWIPQSDASGMVQQIQVPNTTILTNAGWEAATKYGCIGIGYAFSYSVGDGSIYYSPGNICGGGNNYPYLNFRQVSGGGAVYEPQNILFGWNSADGQGAPDTGLSRDSAGVVDVGNGAVGDKTGAMKMASLFLGIASDPGSPSNGQLWYNSTSNLLKAYINGATVALGGGGGGGLNGTVTYTSSQTAASGDNGKLVIMNCSGACAYTLPATQPSTTWQIALQSVGSTTATLGLSGDTYNGGATAPVLVNYDSLPIWANTATSTDYRGGTPLVAGSNVSVTPATNGKTIASTGGGSGPSSIVAGSNVTITEGSPCTTGSCTINASGGGGGGKPVYTIADVPPGSANAMDDEFTEGSLPGKWTSVLTNSGTFTLFNSQYLQGQAPSSGAQAVSAIYQTAPATPWTVTLAMTVPSPDINYLSGGLVIRDSGTGRIVGCTAYNVTQGIRLDDWTNPTTFGGAVGSTSYSNGSQSAHLLYLSFQDDGTNLNCSYSYSGITGTFVTVASEARTSFLANPNQVGIGMLGQASIVAAPVFQWFRRTQ